MLPPAVWSCSLTAPSICGSGCSTDPCTATPPDTPATAARLRAVLAEVRRQGYAYCPGYVHPDALGIAAPVHDARGEVVAALAVIVPNEAGSSSMVPVVRTAAHGVSRALGSGRSSSLTD
jgi:DNA-binding IclR family transcriptional regulator